MYLSEWQRRVEIKKVAGNDLATMQLRWTATLCISSNNSDTKIAKFLDRAIKLAIFPFEFMKIYLSEFPH